MQETRNIKLVAYLRLQKIFPNTVTKLERGKAKFGFEIVEKDWKKHQLDFDKSPYLAYGQSLDAVIDLAY